MATRAPHVGGDLPTLCTVWYLSVPWLMPASAWTKGARKKKRSASSFRLPPSTSESTSPAAAALYLSAVWFGGAAAEIERVAGAACWWWHPRERVVLVVVAVEIVFDLVLESARNALVDGRSFSTKRSCATSLLVFFCVPLFIFSHIRVKYLLVACLSRLRRK